MKGAAYAAPFSLIYRHIFPHKMHREMHWKRRRAKTSSPAKVLPKTFACPCR